MNHALDDVSSRMKIEQQVEARRVIEAIDSALAKDGRQLLTDTEFAEIEKARNQLESIIDSAEVEQLKAAIKNIEKTSETYVSRRMNNSVKQVLQGQQIDEVKVN